MKWDQPLEMTCKNILKVKNMIKYIKMFKLNLIYQKQENQMQIQNL